LSHGLHELCEICIDVNERRSQERHFDCISFYNPAPVLLKCGAPSYRNSWGSLARTGGLG
jgi:hypothetical protein